MADGSATFAQTDEGRALSFLIDHARSPALRAFLAAYDRADWPWPVNLSEATLDDAEDAARELPALAEAVADECLQAIAYIRSR